MKQLPLPVREVLGNRLDEAVSQRVWRELGKRRARPRRSALSWVAWPAAAALAMAVLVIVWKGRVLAPPEPGPLHLAGGGEISLPMPGTDAEASISLDDGSRIAVFPGARVALLENSGRLLTLLLEGGHARFEVTPGGPRRWNIECGSFSVEVVGTRFEIERTAEGGRVHVDEGVVLVRGDRVRDHIQRLAAGQTLEIGPPSPTARVEPPATAEPAASSAPASPSSTASAAGGSGAPTWRELAQKGAYREAYGVLGSGGIAEEARGATLDELMQLADVARLSGHPTDAVAPLSRVVSEHRGDSRASMAAFTLGKLRLDQLGQPAAAASDFAAAIGLGLPGDLVEDAHARLVEARARAGDRAGARAAAAEYERRFPNGRRLAAIRAWAPAE